MTGAGILVAWSQWAWALVQMELVAAASVKKEELVQKESVQRALVHMVFFCGCIGAEGVSAEGVGEWMEKHE